MNVSMTEVPPCPKCGHKKSAPIRGGRVTPNAVFVDATERDDLVDMSVHYCRNEYCGHEFDVVRVTIFKLI